MSVGKTRRVATCLILVLCVRILFLSNFCMPDLSANTDVLDGASGLDINDLGDIVVFCSSLTGKNDHWSSWKIMPPTDGGKARHPEARLEIRDINGTPPPSSGDWVINDTTIVEDMTLIINGSIIVEENGTLILQNSNLYMNLSTDGEYCIDVYGNFTVLGSKITAYIAENNYYIRIFSGAKLRIEDSEIRYAGYEWGTNADHTGLWINTNNATVRNTTIRDGYNGVSLYSANSSLITQNTITNVSCYAIYLEKSYNNVMSKNNITYAIGLYMTSSNNNSYTNNSICYNDTKYRFGIRVISSNYNNFTYNNISGLLLRGIRLESSNYTYIANNRIANNSERNIDVKSSTHCKIMNNTLKNSKYYEGIYLDHADFAEVMYNTISGNHDDGISLYYSPNCTVKYNDFIENQVGVYLCDSDNTVI
ncbi:MAG: nitrous oxide reductase family maturation protein NosD, partial [Candidatus Njordarchaeota archaeon]